MLLVLSLMDLSGSIPLLEYTPDKFVVDVLNTGFGCTPNTPGVFAGQIICCWQHMMLFNGGDKFKDLY